MMRSCKAWGCARRVVPGSRYCSEHQPAAERTGSEGEPVAAPVHNDDGLRSAAAFVYLIATLELLAAVIAGIALIVHKVPACDLNPYDSSLVLCDGSTHPFTGAGFAVLGGGTVNAAVLFVLGRVAQQLSQVRLATRGLLRASGFGLKSEDPES